MCNDGSAELVQYRTGVQYVTTPDKRAQQDLQQQIANILTQTLDIDQAVHIALLNNPDMLWTYAGMGIAEADLAQAGRLQNPSFSFKRTHGEGQAFIERGLSFNLLQLITAPLASQLEQRRYETIKHEVAQAAAKLAGDTRAAYLVAVAANQEARYMEQVADAAQAGRDLAQRMAAAGNWSKLDAARQSVFDAETENDVARAEHARVISIQKLARLLGLEPGTAMKLPDTLPPLPEHYAALQSNMDEAVKARYDVQAAQDRLSGMAQNLGLTRATRFIDVLDLAGVQNRNEGVPIAPGYEITISIPLFDWGSAKSQRAEALYLQAARQLAATALDARSGIAAAEERRHSSYTMAQRYRDDIIPLRKKIADETLLRYNGMLIGVFELLNDSHEQIAATRASLAATKDYWLADNDLQTALGGNEFVKEAP